PGNRYGIVPRRQPARDVVGDLLRRGEQGELEGHRMSPEGLREASSLLSDRAAADAEDVERARRLLEALLVEVDRVLRRDAVDAGHRVRAAGIGIQRLLRARLAHRVAEARVDLALLRAVAARGRSAPGDDEAGDRDDDRRTD